MSTYEGGWIPFHERTQEQQIDHDRWLDDTPQFCDANTGVDLPDESLCWELFELLGQRLPRVWQHTGSCVGASDAVADAIARAGDCVYRGDQERVEPPFPYATWGIGRQMGGMHGPGDGSYGSIQARAAAEWGYLSMEHRSVPRPSVLGEWYSWTANQERTWSWPGNWPTPASELKADASNGRAGKTLPAKSVDEIDQALAQGFGVTMASDYGARNESMRVVDGMLVAQWNAEWAHQMTIGKYKTVSSGRYYLILNQWGPGAHPECPYASKHGVRGAFWVPEKDIVSNIARRGTEVMVHSSTGSFEPQVIRWV